MKKVYISGPITGNMENYKSEFGKAEQMIIDAGCIPLNPAKLPLGLRERDYMRISLAMLEAADLVVLLDGWVHSLGATSEQLYASRIGIPCQMLDSFLQENTEGRNGNA